MKILIYFFLFLIGISISEKIGTQLKEPVNIANVSHGNEQITFNVTTTLYPSEHLQEFFNCRNPDTFFRTNQKSYTEKWRSMEKMT